VPIDVGFYHCTRAPAVEVAVKLAAKALASGERLLMVGERAQLDALDKALWVQDPDSFLAHGFAGTADDPEQPILLSEQPVAGNGARLLLLVEAGVPAELGGFDRVLNLFEEGGAAHQRARADWKALGGREGVARTYWQQTERGGWEKHG
jgi:DNA polymerase III subunit chi